MKILLSSLCSRNYLRLMSQIPTIVLNVLRADRVWLAGGALRSMFDRTPICDFDLFFFGEGDKVLALETLKKAGAVVVFTCPQGSMVTLKFGAFKIQLITPRYYATASELINTFDFTVCRVAFDGTTLTVAPEAIRDARRKRLVIHELEFPISTINRIAKYREKGYWMAESEWITLIQRIQTTQFEPEKLVLYID